MNVLNPQIGLKGFVKVDVVDHNGKLVREGKTQRNLILDSGLGKLAEVPICDLFLWAVKGNDTSVMKEAVTGTYTQTGGGPSGTLTRATGTRIFTTADIDKLVRSSDGKESMIVSIVDDTHATVQPVGSAPTLAAFTALAITLYSVGDTAITTETTGSRTDQYSTLAGENTTTTSGATRTFKRTFLFTPEAESLESPVGFMATWAGTGVTKTAGRAFVGGSDPATSDVGKYLKFLVTGEYCKIVSVTSGTVVVVDRAPVGSNVGAAAVFYGFNSYSHIGFTWDEAALLAIKVRLETGGGTPTPVYALGDNPETPGQQVKVTYTMVVTFAPASIQTATGLFGGDTSAMGGTSKNGTYVLEALGTSIVSDDGTTDITSIGLEPCAGGSVALSTSAAALVPLTPTSNPPDRSDGAQSVDMTADSYVGGSFTRTVTGTFGTGDGNGTLWRTFGIFDEDSRQFLLTFLWGAVQKKPATHQLTLHFRKTWNRDLS